MRLLLDTHSFLWFAQGNPKLSKAAKSAIEDGDNDILLSIASIWEMAIKISLGQLRIDGDLDEFLKKELSSNEIALLDIRLPHVVCVSQLPFHHRDPFDRMIIAQSLMEGFPVISCDEFFESYGVSKIW